MPFHSDKVGLALWERSAGYSREVMFRGSFIISVDSGNRKGTIKIKQMVLVCVVYKLARLL
jgi:hypothetical protein